MFESIHPLVVRLQKRHLLALPQVSPEWYVLVAALIGLLVVPNLARAQSCTPDFVITPTPNGPQYNRLRGVAAFAVDDVWGVGFANGNNDQTLTEHWDGSTWTIISPRCKSPTYRATVTEMKSRPQ